MYIFFNQITVKALSSQRKKQLEFQMKNNDLHIQMATILELVRENIASSGWSEKNDKMLKETIKDLMTIHDNYQVSFQSKSVKCERS